jgi:predicted pyridoxine 5'-phosphate oxidase superfamily flavin-nucleotide-binding protein
LAHGDEAEIPPHFSLNFERGAELSEVLRKEIAEHHWEVAGAQAYPWLMAVDEDLVARPPTAQEITIAEALAIALPTVLKEKKALLAAWRGGKPVSRTLLVTTHAGDIEVLLRVPYER